MDASKRAGRRLDLVTAPEREVEDALIHWDELAPGALEDLARHGVHGPRLRRLQLAEAWLEERAAGEVPPGVLECPAPEELYDYGRGPGATPLAPERRAQLDRHTLRCGPCRGLVATLERRPPAPLDLLAPAARPGPRGAVLPTTAARRPRSLTRWLPLAAAAAALVIALPLWQRSEPLPGLPGRPLLRDGSGAEALLLPRGPLLVWPAPGLERRVELSPVPGAEHYRVQLQRHEGGAFEAGDPAGELVAEGPSLVLPQLAPGRYTYVAWARVDGLDRHLGARDFQVVEDPDLAASLARVRGEGDLRRLIAVLDERTFWTDARALARLLPPSGERDAYLDAPGR